MSNNLLIQGNSLNVLQYLPDESVQCIITSPPYWGLRNYETEGQIGLEKKLDKYLEKLFLIFNDLKRILRDDGTFWLNIGDSYTSGNRTYRANDKKNGARKLKTRPKTPEGLKPKDLIGIPWRIALKLQESGWYLRNDIIWHKPNAMPESVKDRPYRNHEYLFLFSKNEHYYFNHKGLEYNSKKLRSIWTIPVNTWSGRHIATFPVELITPCINSSTKKNDIILDPFFGSGTVGCVCEKLNRRYWGIELNSKYTVESLERLENEPILVPEKKLSKKCKREIFVF